MREQDYDYSLYMIDKTLTRQDIEQKDGIVSFYDMIEYAKRGLEELKEIISQNSKLAKKINSSNPIKLLLNNYFTSVSLKKSYIDNTCESTINIYSSFGIPQITLIKKYGETSISIEPYNKKTQVFVTKYFDDIMETFNTIEKYSYFFTSFDNEIHRYIRVYDSMFYVNLYYNSQGDIKTVIEMKNAEQNYIRKQSLKKVLDENKEKLLKKFSFDLNDDLRKESDNHIVLLARKQYFSEQSCLEIEKKKVLK